MTSRLRDLATQEAIAHGYECDARDRQRAIDLAVMVGEMAVKEFAEKVAGYVDHFADRGIKATLKDWGIEP